MDTTYPTPNGIASINGGPTWEVANLFPSQGNWSEEEFLALPSPNFFELCNGRLDVLPMPTWLHATIGFIFAKYVDAYLKQNSLGRVATAPLNVRLWPLEIRQPDVVFCFHENIHDIRKTQNGADLVMEVLNPGADNRERDLVVKRELYAKAGIREYWIIDPEERKVSVLTLAGSQYQVAGEYQVGGIAESILLPGFRLDVAELFAEAEQK